MEKLAEQFETESNVDYLKVEQKLKLKKKENKIRNRFALAKKIYLEWSSRSDINNYGKIFDYQGNILAQTLWTIIFICLTSLTIVLIQMSISSYLTYSVTTSYDIVYESPTYFPTITMCAGNPFVSWQAISLFKELALNNSLDFYNNITDLITLAKMYSAHPSYADEDRKKLGLSIDSISSCQFNKKDCKNDLHWIWLYDYGNCFQFNSGLNLTNKKIDLTHISRTGSDYGLNVKFSFYFSNVSGNSPSQVQFDNFDFVCFIHNSSNKVTSSNFFYFPYNFKARLSVGRTSIRKQASPYSKCIDLSSYSSVYHDYLVQTNNSYRQLDCLDLCMQQHIIGACGCYDQRYQCLNNKYEPCLNLTQFVCSENQINNFESSECITASCPLECDSVKYELEYSIGNPRCQPQKNRESEGITSLSVFYPSLEYTQISESPQTTFINLLTQLGGSLGMFISFSVFTLFEGIEILILIVHALFFNLPKDIDIRTNQVTTTSTFGRT